MAVLIGLLWAGTVWAAPAANSEMSNSSLRIALQLTLLALLPVAFTTLTPFLRISIVLHFLRQAMGAQTVPSNQVIVGLSAMITLALLAAPMNRIQEEVVVPYNQGVLSEQEALNRIASAAKTYMAPNLGEKEVALMVRLTHQAAPKNVNDLSFPVVGGAYVLTELKTAFKIGVLLYMPFLIVDLIVSAVIVTLGMIQLPPVMISAPFKILIFVLADGWTLILDSLIKTFEVVR